MYRWFTPTYKSIISLMKYEQLASLVGYNIKRCRERAKLTQEELSDKTGFNYKYYQRVESRKANLTLCTISRISEVLEVHPLGLPSTNQEEIGLSSLSRGVSCPILQIIGSETHALDRAPNLNMPSLANAHEPGTLGLGIVTCQAEELAGIANNLLLQIWSQNARIQL